VRKVWLIGLALILWPAVALAADSVQHIVESAVKALSATSYEGRMRFLSQFELGQELTVHIYHVAPDLYHVMPLVNGQAGDMFYIENAEELVRCSSSQHTAVQMPVRQFSVNDALTMKFLRDLGTHPGTTVLDGMVGDYPVYVLRQDKQKEKPYTITVGLDKHNYFPLFLLVTDGLDVTRVYYEMEVIEYRKSSEIDDAYFTVPASGKQHQQQAPRAPKADVPVQTFVGPLLPGSEGGKTVSSDAAYTGGALPLFPGWLPRGYQLESITPLNYSPTPNAAPALVYQFEVFGPVLADTVSIFQTQNLNFDFGVECNSPDCGFYVSKQSGWLVAVLGNQKMDQLKHIAQQLYPDDQAVSGLLEQTTARDDILHQAVSASY
jgi:hypothetical protein